MRPRLALPRRRRARPRRRRDADARRAARSKHGEAKLTHYRIDDDAQQRLHRLEDAWARRRSRRRSSTRQLEAASELATLKGAPATRRRDGRPGDAADRAAAAGGVARRRRVVTVRWRIAILVSAAIAISYLDRQTLPVAIKAIERDIPITQRAVLAAAVGVPDRLCGDVRRRRQADGRARHARRASLAIMLFWSLACASHGLATSVGMLAVSRLLLGIGEGGGFPAATRAVAEWFPVTERSTAMGIINAGTAVGGVIAPPLIALVLTHRRLARGLLPDRRRSAWSGSVWWWRDVLPARAAPAARRRGARSCSAPVIGAGRTRRSRAAAGCTLLRLPPDLGRSSSPSS